jgi:hypothetical protein
MEMRVILFALQHPNHFLLFIPISLPRGLKAPTGNRKFVTVEDLPQRVVEPQVGGPPRKPDGETVQQRQNSYSDAVIMSWPC